jgi:1,4-dihydroxy-2-naphthoyl-CoA hydrolase
MNVGMSLENTMLEYLGIEILEATKDRVRMRMPVGPKVHQPYGLLHGGASVVLAESAASVGTALNIDHETQWAVGLEINANHLRAVRDGHVTAEAIPAHRGRSTMVWTIELRDDADRLVCLSRCTVAITARRG